MKVLLDTCTLAELRKPSPHAAVVPAVQSIHDARLYVSVLLMGEIAVGVALLPNPWQGRSPGPGRS